MKRAEPESQAENDTQSADSSSEKSTCGECKAEVQLACGYLDCPLKYCPNCGSQCSYCKRVVCFDCCSPRAGLRMEQCTKCEKFECQDCPVGLARGAFSIPDFLPNGDDNTQEPKCIECFKKEHPTLAVHQQEIPICCPEHKNCFHAKKRDEYLTIDPTIHQPYFIIRDTVPIPNPTGIIPFSLVFIEKKKSTCWPLSADMCFTLGTSLINVSKDATVMPTNASNSVPEGYQCVLCLEKERTQMCQPCNHLLLCVKCSTETNIKRCCLCNCLIDSWTHVFR